MVDRNGGFYIVCGPFPTLITSMFWSTDLQLVKSQRRLELWFGHMHTDGQPDVKEVLDHCCRWEHRTHSVSPPRTNESFQLSFGIFGKGSAQ